MGGAFSYEIIAYLGASQAALDAIEIWGIKSLNILVSDRYNLKISVNRGKHSEESKRKLSGLRKGKKNFRGN